MTKLETDVVRQYNPPFYDRYVDDCFSKKVKGEPNHPNINFTAEQNSDHFLDTRKIRKPDLSMLDLQKTRKRSNPLVIQGSNKLQEAQHFWSSAQSKENFN